MNYKFIPIFILLIIIILYNSARPQLIEGFDSYNTCIADGYPQGFCISTPIESSLETGFCSCAQGFFGAWHRDEGKCYCYLFNGLLPYKTSQPYHSSPF